MRHSVHLDLKQNSYDITIEKGLFGHMAEEIGKIYSGGKVFVLTDSNVGPLYLAPLLEQLEKEGFGAGSLTLEAGEATKNIRSLPGIYAALLDAGLTRKDLLVTLGGGVIGDLGGFAASTYLRGIPFVQIPTSLLAQVDSSVGGKVAVDLEQGKNLVGSFYQPKGVLIDPLLLDSLPERFYRDGMAEVIKYGCIFDQAFFALLNSLSTREQAMGQMEQIVARCCDLKRQVVERDERDQGERMLLNFGHTLGHGVEKYQGFTGNSHGEAVAMGMYAITQKSERLGLTDPGTAAAIREILVRHGLPVSIGLPASRAMDAIRRDKKNLGGRIQAVLLRRIGEAYLYDTTPAFFEDIVI